MRIIALFLSLLPLLTAAETVYKSVDEQGNVIFSDQPSANAEKFEVEAAPSIDFREVTIPTRAAEKKKTTAYYQEIMILEPGNEQTVRDNPGNLNVFVASNPALREGDQYQLVLDGQSVSAGRDNTVKLQNIDRGEHTLTAQIVNNEGKVLLTSRPSTFYMHRISKLTSPLNKDKNNSSSVSPTNPPRVVPDGVTPQNLPQAGAQQPAPLTPTTP